jgi:hypothetical protein
MGTRAYLSCTVHEELVKGHCLIVPIQHHLNMLEGDDDTWDEVKVSSIAIFICFTYIDELHSEFYEVPHADVC